MKKTFFLLLAFTAVFMAGCVGTQNPRTISGAGTLPDITYPGMNTVHLSKEGYSLTATMDQVTAASTPDGHTVKPVFTIENTGNKTFAASVYCTLSNYNFDENTGLGPGTGQLKPKESKNVTDKIVITSETEYARSQKGARLEVKFEITDPSANSKITMGTASWYVDLKS